MKIALLVYSDRGMRVTFGNIDLSAESFSTQLYVQTADC